MYQLRWKQNSWLNRFRPMSIVGEEHGSSPHRLWLCKSLTFWPPGTQATR